MVDVTKVNSIIDNDKGIKIYTCLTWPLASKAQILVHLSISILVWEGKSAF